MDRGIVSRSGGWSSEIARISALISALAITGCGKQAPPPAPAAAAAPVAVDRARAKALFGVPPAQVDNPQNPITDPKVALGRTLFFDPRLSKDGDVSCNSCHSLESYGVDREATSKGHKGQRGDRNSPTVYFAAGHVAQFWDGRAADVEEQAKGPVLNPVEMAMPDAASVEQRLAQIPGYVAMFKAAFPEAGEAGVTFDNMAKAIGAFERTLNPRSRFDAWLEGKDDALTADEQHGLTLLVDTGCIACHNGPLLGARTFQKLGKVEAWPFAARGDKDEGRKRFTGKDEDLHHFKVPTLRNVVKTGPYFHDGKTTDLAEAVRLMAKHQLGRSLDDAQTAKIVAFLGALTSEVPPAMRTAPERPPEVAPPAAAPEGGAPAAGAIAPAPPTPGPAPSAASAVAPAPAAAPPGPPAGVQPPPAAPAAGQPAPAAPSP